MKIKQHILTLIIFASLISCNNLKTDSAKRVVLLHHYPNETTYRTDTIYLDKLVNNDSIKYLYKSKNKTLWFSFLKDAKNDTSIILLNVRCPLISTKEINVKGEKFEIKKYYYDNMMSNDEESSFFCNNKYGILLLFNEGWSNLKFTLEYDSISKILIENILQDKTGFYTGNILPSQLE